MRSAVSSGGLSDLVITAIAVLFASLALAPELKCLIVAAVAVLACYLIGYAATRVPGISKVSHGNLLVVTGSHVGNRLLP